MIEKHSINERDVWLRVDPSPLEVESPNVAPTEYFIASYYLQDPEDLMSMEILMLDEDGKLKLFESPFAALEYLTKKLETEV